MVLILLVVGLGLALLIWLWKGPVQNTVTAMKRNGSSTVEAYGVILFITSAMGISIYLIMSIL
ncbi:hypothetical protein CK503_06685 [Aliifodinibius salipaludis]|uniref:Uncharacterized protein n=1 Tax=Fodinibius salipaludis TaxID=2032627 RepID=A0A2A2GC92_9BACT|nr:hypothetical protein CK503_06685 [Aliifodinibius salipaludis]